MQAFKSANDSVQLLSNIAQKPAAQHKDSKEENSEFLSMVLEAAAAKGESLDEKDIKNIVNSVNMSVQKRAQAEQKSESINIKEILSDQEADRLFSNVTFMQLLQILEMLNGGEKISKFPNFTVPLAKALSNEANITELKGAKNIHELIAIAKRLNLGLEKITVTKEQVSELNAKFPNLAKNGFFTPVAPTQIYSAELKAKVEDAIELSKDGGEPIKLNRLLQEISKEIAGENKINLQKSEKITPNENLAKNSAAQGVLIKEAATQNIQKDQIKTDAIKVENAKSDEKSLNASKVNLQSLLYPEREQSEANSGQSGAQSESELNSMVREIMQNARAQSKNLQLVRQTFDNFNTTLKEQIEAYKSPFMRFNITLNPLNLGEVEITMVNRGNNLHINFNSTTQTMNLFLQNQAEFKASLVNMGFTELEMNFSDQNQRKEQGEKSYKGLKLKESDSAEGENVALLEIVLPKYI